MMKPRRSAVIAILLTAGLTASACGQGAPGSGGGAGGKNRLVLWHMEQPPNRVRVFQKIIDQFNKKHSGIKVVQQAQDWNQVYSKIAASVQSGQQPDILFTIPDFTTYVNSMGVVQPVNGLVKDLNREHRFLPNATAPYKKNGKYLAVPLYGMIQMLWYRKDLFRKAGISKSPATWDDLRKDAARLTHSNQHGIALPAGKNLATDQVIYSLMITARAEKLYGTGDSIAFDNPRTVKTFKLYNDLLKYSPSDSASYSWGEPQAAFNNGTAAMAIEKGQYLGPFEEESGRPNSDLGCAPIPQPTGGQPGSIYYPNAAMVLTKDSKKQKMAGEFLHYLLEPKVYGKFLNAEPGLFLPVTKDGEKAQSWWSNPVISKYKGCVNAMLQQSRSGQLFGFADGSYHDSIGKISGQNIFSQTIQRMYVDKTSPEAAVSWGDSQMRKATGG